MFIEGFEVVYFCFDLILDVIVGLDFLVCLIEMFGCFEDVVVSVSGRVVFFLEVIIFLDWDDGCVVMVYDCGVVLLGVEGIVVGYGVD